MKNQLEIILLIFFSFKIRKIFDLNIKLKQKNTHEKEIGKQLGIVDFLSLNVIFKIEHKFVHINA